MTIIPITQREPACYGVCCERHHECQRYEAVENSTTSHVIATCDDGHGARPLFVESEQVGAA